MTRWLVLLLVSLALVGAVAQTSPVTPLPEVERQGTGPRTLLLIPCMSCRWEAWAGFMERNAEAYTMYAVTLPGFGGTPVPALPMNTRGTPWRQNAIAALSRLIDDERLRDVTVVGHSFGTMVAVQLAAARPDAITRLVAVDGSIESTSWIRSDPDARLEQACKVVDEWGAKLHDAEAWQNFNGVRLPEGDTVDRERALEAVRLHGSFMATPREVVLQYWRENPLIDLTADLKRLRIPVLDIKALRSEPEKTRAQHLADLAEAGVGDRVRTVFMYDTPHFVMLDRLDALSELVARFVAGQPVQDLRP